MTPWAGALALAAAFAASAQTPPIPAASLRSGITYAGANVRAMQDDDLQNPGMLWSERGKALWSTAPAAGRPSCAQCHDDAATTMRGVAARYPAWDTGASHVVDLSERIEACRTVKQGAAALPREAEDRNALEVYVASMSRDMPIAVVVDGPARSSFERGRAFYYQRRGQMNLACANCHEQNVGKRLFAETISQGHGNAFPAYRLEWQSVGSLQRRLRACLNGVHAEAPSEGTPILTDLELFLAWREQGLPIETPGVRR